MLRQSRAASIDSWGAGDTRHRPGTRNGCLLMGRKGSLCRNESATGSGRCLSGMDSSTNVSYLGRRKGQPDSTTQQTWAALCVRLSDGLSWGDLVLQRHVRQLSISQVIIVQELKSFLRILIRTWLINQNPCETSHFLAIGVLTQR